MLRDAVPCDGSKIKALSKTLGVHCTQEWLAEKTGCSLSVIQKAYQGKSIERENLECIAVVLNVGVDSLIKDEYAFTQEMLEAIPLPVFFKDRHGIYRGCNERFCLYLGRKRDQIIGKTVFDVALPRNAEIYQAKDQELMADPRGEQIYKTDVEAAKEKRSVVFFKGTFSRRGAVEGIIGVIVDFTYCLSLPTEVLQSK